MSKHNKANKSNYVQAGRLSPDDMARERSKMRQVGGDRSRGKTHDEPGRRAPDGQPAAQPIRESDEEGPSPERNARE